MSNFDTTSTGGKARPTLVLLTCVWGRPRLTQAVLGYYRRLQRQLESELDLQLLAVGSEGTRSQQLCEAQEFRYVEYANSPLSHKWNAGVQAARALDPDALVIAGSDDLLSSELLRTYRVKLEQGFDFFGFRDLYFFELAAARLGYWRGYESSADAVAVDSPVGCGRCFSRDLLNKTGWKLWPRHPRVDRFLDLVALHYLDLFGIRPSIWTMQALGGTAVDIKSGTNINHFDDFRYEFLLQAGEAWNFFSTNMDDDSTNDLMKLHYSLVASRMATRHGESQAAEMDHQTLHRWVRQMRSELGM